MSGSRPRKRAATAVCTAVALTALWWFATAQAAAQTAAPPAFSADANTPASQPADGLGDPLAERFDTLRSAWSDPAAADVPWRARPEQWLRDAIAKAPADVRARLAQLRTNEGQKIAFGLVGALAVLFAFTRLRRGHGDLVVCLEYPPELRGDFSIRVDGKPGRKPTTPRRDRRQRPGRAASTRTEHHAVSRETHFQRLRPRRYYVVVEGRLFDPDNGELVEEIAQEHTADVKRGEGARLAIVAGPKDCPVDVRIVWDKRPAKEAAVALRGQLHSLRYASGGSTRVRLRPGRHVIVAGSGDRVGEQEVEITSFGHAQVEIDLTTGDHLVFKGCPPAVEPYLNGDLNASARELERDGQSREADLMLARMHRDDGRNDRAAEYFEKAGDALEAARLRAATSDFARAATLFAEGGESLRAAEMFQRAGDLLRAGEAFEAGQDLGSAIDCYREAGDTQRWLDALERRGDAFEAARIALDTDPARAVRLLQQISGADPHYPEACQLLADAFEAEGHRDMAAAKLHELVASQSPDAVSPDLLDRLAGLQEDSGDYANALASLEQLRHREPTWPNLATRVEALRKQVSVDQMSQTATAVGPASPVTSGFETRSRYEIDSELGRGGMGVVFKARDTRLNRVVALKRLPENLKDHPKAIQLFLREAQASARLNHSNIVTLYDVDCIEGVYFITMELLEGLPLNHVLRNKGRIGPRDVARLGIQIANGLAYAHEQRIVHRDIKTANLFFTKDRVVKIMDFGLAKMIEEVRRASTVIGGTPYYMAPEQATGEAVDHRADLYAFGITLYELVTGSVPFSDGDVVYQHRHTAPPDPRTRAAVPDPFAELILHMIEKEPARRIASASEVAQELDQLLQTL